MKLFLILYIHNHSSQFFQHFFQTKHRLIFIRLFFHTNFSIQSFDVYNNEYIIQMQLLQRCMLRRQNSILALKYGMASLKLHSLSSSTKNRHISFRDNQFISQKTIQGNPSSHSIQLQNKQLYLRYVQEVLTSKEQELVQLQQHLSLRRARLDEQEAQLKLATPLAINQQAELLSRKVKALREVAFKVAGNRNQAAVVRELQDFQRGLTELEEDSRRTQEAAGAELQQTMMELAEERQDIAAKRSKLGQLQSYEKYLNELQAALQQKEYQVILRERELQQMSLAFCESNTQTLSLKQPQQFNTYQQQSNPDQSNADHSIRKRARIFEPRTLSHQQLPQHKESSKIMQQNSTNDYTKQKISKGSQSDQHPVVTVCTMSTINTAMQTAMMDNQVAATCLRLSAESATVKFMKLWIKFSQKRNRAGVNHQKTMILYLWRLNALFDQQVKSKIQQAFFWPKRVNSLLTSDYKDLSLKKRRYYELFFDYQRKLFQREKTLVRLRAVLKNKNRRERTAVFLAFQRYRNNAKMMSLMALFQCAPTTQRILIQKPTNPITEAKPKPASRTDSRILGTSTSNIENRLLSDHSKGKLSSKMTPSASTISKSRVMPQQAAIDIPKLKEYIKNQEETEVKLAMECARTQAVFRIGTVLSSNLCRLRTRFIVNAIRIGQTSKLNALEKAMSGCQFKWELFMAKARLALTTNSNKIAHLEQLVSFMDCK